MSTSEARTPSLRARVLAGFGAAGFALLGAALAPDLGCIQTDPCLRNSDCTHGERCIEGACAVPPPETTASGDATTDAFEGTPPDADAAETDETDAPTDDAETTDETATDGGDDTLDDAAG